MKTVRLKRIFSLSLVFAMLLAGASCSRKGDEPLGEPSSQTTAAEATTSATTTAATTAATTVPKRDPVTLGVIENGRCEFSVLCNFNSRTTKAEAE